MEIGLGPNNDATAKNKEVVVELQGNQKDSTCGHINTWIRN